ncbi:hypothetical protein SVAN01_00849 [Stagonosporopsis vannaccii]|nr:hypothetical protein SVAN01_00849 [Stagonosporopsis vannaccii]
MPKLTRRSTRTQASALPTHRQTRSRTHPAPATRPQVTHTRRPPKPKPFAFLSRAQDIVTADPNRQLPLFSLPPPLLQRIADDLPLVSLICLTLTCHHAVVTLGTSSWALSKREPWSMNRPEFVELFTREWGDVLTFCARCDTLHPLTKPPREHVPTGLTRRCWGPGASVDYFPRDGEGRGYSLVFAHIAAALDESAIHASPGATGPPISSLAGDYTVHRANLRWRVQSSARRVDGNLVLKHVHSFRHTLASSLKPHDILHLPLRLCPHQSTATAPPLQSRYLRHASAYRNGPLLTHAICSSFPRAAGFRIDIDTGPFKRLAPSEHAQIAQQAAGENVLWRCRACATKYRVERAREGEQVVVTSWHCFGRDAAGAARRWREIVRRTGPMLGTETRNDEWWSKARGVSDFVCEV